MDNRFYVMSVQHNKEKQAENRTVPKAFDDIHEATAEFHRQLGSDMKNDTLDWSMCVVINNQGVIHKSEYWEEAKPEPEVVETEESPE